jgi:hypothetical protein
MSRLPRAVISIGVIPSKIKKLERRLSDLAEVICQRDDGRCIWSRDG